MKSIVNKLVLVVVAIACFVVAVPSAEANGGRRIVRIRQPIVQRQRIVVRQQVVAAPIYAVPQAVVLQQAYAPAPVILQQVVPYCPQAFSAQAIFAY